MSKFGEIFQGLVVETLNETYQFIVRIAPNVAVTIIILLVGWLCAVIIKKIIAKMLKALGFDVLSEKTGLRSFLEKAGIKRSPSSLIGLVFYWLIIFSALTMVFSTLDLQVAYELMRQVVLYMPKIIVALLLLALGAFLGEFVGRFVLASSKLANIPFPEALGKVAHYAIVGLAIMMALEHLGVATIIVTHSFIIIFGVIPIMICLVFLIGGKDIIASILSGRLLINEYKKGDTVEFDSISGQIESVDLVITKIKNGETQIIIPNSELAKKTVRKK